MNLFVSLYCRQVSPSAESNHFTGGEVIGQKELLMDFFSQLSAHFWLLFALAISIAVIRELRRERD